MRFVKSSGGPAGEKQQPVDACAFALGCFPQLLSGPLSPRLPLGSSFTVSRPHVPTRRKYPFGVALSDVALDRTRRRVRQRLPGRHFVCHNRGSWGSKCRSVNKALGLAGVGNAANEVHRYLLTVADVGARVRGDASYKTIQGVNIYHKQAIAIVRFLEVP